jgi:hypothetical protein
LRIERKGKSITADEIPNSKAGFDKALNIAEVRLAVVDCYATWSGLSKAISFATSTEGAGRSEKNCSRTL